MSRNTKTQTLMNPLSICLVILVVRFAGINFKMEPIALNFNANMCSTMSVSRDGWMLRNTVRTAKGK